MAIADTGERARFMAGIERLLQDQGLIIQPYWGATYRHHIPEMLGAEKRPTSEIHSYKLALGG